MKRQRNSKYRNRNVTFPDDIWELAQRQANKVNRPVANYLQTLVLKDAGKFDAEAAAA